MMNELKKLDLLMGKYTLNSFITRDDSIDYQVNARKLKRVYEIFKLMSSTITEPYYLMYCDLNEVEAIITNAENEKLNYVRVR